MAKVQFLVNGRPVPPHRAGDAIAAAIQDKIEEELSRRVRAGAVP